MRRFLNIPLRHRFRSRSRSRSATRTPDDSATVTTTVPDPAADHPTLQEAPPPHQDVEHQHDHDGPAEETSNPWSAAYSAALAELEEGERKIIGQSQDLEALFNNLTETNDKHQSQSILRRGMIRIKKPVTYLDAIVKLAAPAAGLDPAASAAVGIVRGVITLALGVCGVEERLEKQISKMLEQINIIGECDTLGQKFDSSNIHKTLVKVYKDLFKFYCTVIELLSKKSVAVAWISEQLNERVPPLVGDFLDHASQLHTHISNATSETVKSIESMLIDSKIQQLLGAQKVEKSDRLQSDLTKRTAKDACRWITGTSTFRTWYGTAAEHPLVLYGDMGCGKTVTMSFLIDHIRQTSKLQIPCALVCYHYCQDDETGQPLYIYSSLVQQLMRQKPQLKIQFNQWCSQRHSEGNDAPTQDSALVAKFFFDSIQALDRQVFVFLDGLDECSDAACEELVTGFKQHAHSIPGLRACLSSRYNEEIRDLLQGSQEIRISKDLERDTAIVSYLADNRLKFLKNESRALVIESMSRLAEGSAIWVTKAIDLLATRKISAPAKLRDFLQIQLPRFTLSDLYASLFSHITGNDRENRKLLSAGLEVLAASARHLSILELGWAMALREESQVTTVKELEDYVDTKRLFGLLVPFIGSVNFEDLKGRQVHVVHQSVRELIFSCTPSQWMISNAVELSLPSPTRTSTDVVQRPLEIHGDMMRHCMQYLLMDDLENLKLLSEEQDGARIFQEDLPNFIDDDDDDDDDEDEDEDKQYQEGENEGTFCDPSERGFGEFFTYASCYWLYHMRRAHEYAQPDVSRLITLTTAGTTRADNWWDQFHRPDCIFHRSNDQLHSPQLDPLSITSLYGSEPLLRDVLERTEASSSPGKVVKQRQLGVGAILHQRGDISMLPILIPFRPGEDVGDTMKLIFEILRGWSVSSPEVRSHFEVVFDYVAAAVDTIAAQEWGNELLCVTASYDCLPLATRLFRAAAAKPALKRELLRTCDRFGQGMIYHQSIGDAAWNGQGAMIAFLLQQDGIDAHLSYRDVRGNNVLHKATRKCDVDTFKLLLSRYPQGADEMNVDGDTPLRLLVFDRKRTELAEALFQVGRADVRCGFTEQPSNWGEPIRMAVRYCDVRMCQALVRVGGADPMSVFIPRENGTLEFIDKLDNQELADQLRDTLLSLEEERKAKRALNGGH